MAHIVPSDPTDYYLAQANTAEIATLRLLKKSLPSDYTVFHSVHWSRSHKGGTAFGELDFVVVNRAGEILVIEQKNGLLGEGPRGLTKTYSNGERGVAQQLHRSLDNLRSKLKTAFASDDPVHIDYLLYCPDYRVKELNAAGLDRSRIVDAPEKSNLPQFIQKLLGAGAGSGRERRQKVVGFFCQTFDVVPDIHAHASESERVFTRLSEGLGEVITSIEMTPLRLRIKGTAGCGKSHIALRLFGRAIERGEHPLLVCFNRPLREKLLALAPKGGVVQTWYGLCDQFLSAIGQKPDFGNYQLSPAFWRDVQDKVLAAPSRREWTFDTIIVDEGQDFDAEWLDILRLFHADGGDLIWLEDSAQNVFMKDPVGLDGFVTYHARKNYRTPQSIARDIRGALPFQFDCANDLEGLGVGYHPYAKPGEQISILNNIVVGLLKQGFRYEDIAVLSYRGTGNSAFSSLDKVGSHTLKHFSGEYDMFGNQVFTQGKLLFETVGRFKGQQAPAVILTDIDPKADAQERAQRLMFCGMTRATLRMELLFNEANPFCDRFSTLGD